MDTMARIRNHLLSGKAPTELIRMGFSKSTVYSVQRKLQNEQESDVSPGVDDELVQLRRNREIAKLVLEIQEVESKKERLPQRIDNLEKQVRKIKVKQRDIVASMMYSIFRLRGLSHEEAKEQAAEGIREFFS